MVLVDATVLVAGLAVLWFAGDKSVRYSVELSRLLGISSFTVGFLLVSVSTGLPEIVTVVVSSLGGVPELSAGDVIGSSLVNLTLILGVSAVAAGGLKVERETEETLVQILAVITIMASTVLLVSRLTWWHGLLLLLTYAVSVYYLGRTGIAERIFSEEEEQAEEAVEAEVLGAGAYGTSTKLLASLGLMVVGARLTVESAVALGGSMGISLETLGATVIAVGTGLPELSLELNSVRRREYELAMGDIFGSTMVNLTFILGLLSLVSHPHVATLPLTGALVFIGVALAFIWFHLFKDHEIDSREGWLLVALFLVYLVQEYGVAGVT